jgi:hypothetical protein
MKRTQKLTATKNPSVGRVNQKTEIQIRSIGLNVLIF